MVPSLKDANCKKTNSVHGTPWSWGATLEDMGGSQSLMARGRS